jgi:hypothetical protein
MDKQFVVAIKEKGNHLKPGLGLYEEMGFKTEPKEFSFYIQSPLIMV